MKTTKVVAKFMSHNIILNLIYPVYWGCHIISGNSALHLVLPTCMAMSVSSTKTTSMLKILKLCSLLLFRHQRFGVRVGRGGALAQNQVWKGGFCIVPKLQVDCKDLVSYSKTSSCFGASKNLRKKPFLSKQDNSFLSISVI